VLKFQWSRIIPSEAERLLCVVYLLIAGMVAICRDAERFVHF